MANLAINGGTPVRTEPYPSWPTFDDNDLKIFEAVYRSGVWGTGGSRVPEFEERFASALIAARRHCTSRSKLQVSGLATKSSQRLTHSKRRSCRS